MMRALGKISRSALIGLGFHACAFSLIYLVTRTGEPGYLTAKGRWILWLEGFPTTWILHLVEREQVQALPLFLIFTLVSVQWLAIGVLCRNLKLEMVRDVLRHPLTSKIAKNTLAMLAGSVTGVALHAALFLSILAIVCPPISLYHDDRCYNWLMLESFPISFPIMIIEIHARMNHLQKFIATSVQWIAIGGYMGVVVYNIFFKKRDGASKVKAKA